MAIFKLEHVLKIHGLANKIRWLRLVFKLKWIEFIITSKMKLGLWSK